MSVETEVPAAPAQRDAPNWVGAIAGVLAMVAGLASAELVVGLRSAWVSPVVSVGDRVVDNVPAPLKEWAISAFGTADKMVLLAGVGVLLAALAAVIGVQALRRGPVAAIVGVGAVALVGVLASLGRGADGSGGVIPSLLAGVVATGALVLLVQRWNSASGTVADVDSEAALPTPMGTSPRRVFLGTAAAVGAGAFAVGAAGRWLGQRSVATTQRLATVLPRARTPLAPVPPGADLEVRGLSPFITPNDEFYRIDTALSLPQVDPREWTLRVVGRVEQQLTFTYEELLDRPMVEADITLSCVSNEIGGDLVGNARWLGCRLDDLLAEAGIDPAADQIVGRSVDGFTAGFPTALLDGRDALVAVGMNGEPLPIRHGFPARLVVPGVYGYVSATKWLSEIELTRFDEFEGYWIPRGWAVEAPIKTQSRIDTPARGAEVAAGEPVAVAGVAWSSMVGIDAVEVRVDDGPWREARLGEQYVGTTWRQWVLEWDAEPGEHRIQVRATDGGGDTQTERRTDVAPDGASGWHTISVTAA